MITPDKGIPDQRELTEKILESAGQWLTYIWEEEPELQDLFQEKLTEFGVPVPQKYTKMALTSCVLCTEGLELAKQIDEEYRTVLDSKKMFNRNNLHRSAHYNFLSCLRGYQLVGEALIFNLGLVLGVDEEKCGAFVNLKEWEKMWSGFKLGTTKEADLQRIAAEYGNEMAESLSPFDVSYSCEALIRILHASHYKNCRGVPLLLQENDQYALLEDYRSRAENIPERLGITKAGPGTNINYMWALGFGFKKGEARFRKLYEAPLAQTS